MLSLHRKVFVAFLLIASHLRWTLAFASNKVINQLLPPYGNVIFKFNSFNLFLKCKSWWSRWLGCLWPSQGASLAAFVPWSRTLRRWSDLSDATAFRLDLSHFLRRRILNHWRQIRRTHSSFRWQLSLLYLMIFIECDYKWCFRMLASKDGQVLFLALIVACI